MDYSEILEDVKRLSKSLDGTIMQCEELIDDCKSANKVLCAVELRKASSRMKWAKEHITELTNKIERYEKQKQH